MMDNTVVTFHRLRHVSDIFSPLRITYNVSRKKRGGVRKEPMIEFKCDACGSVMKRRIRGYEGRPLKACPSCRKTTEWNI